MGSTRSLGLVFVGKGVDGMMRNWAGWTGLEPAASGVTGRRYNRLNYHPEVLAKQCRRATY
jgi:hypothetical protein